MMNADTLKLRTRQFALRSIKLVNALPKTIAGKTIGNQFVRCATSVGANYHATCRARSKAEFISKIGLVLEETDESLFWLQLIVDAGLLPAKRVTPLLTEAQELTAIFTTTLKTARRRLSN